MLLQKHYLSKRNFYGFALCVCLFFCLGLRAHPNLTCSGQLLIKYYSSKVGLQTNDYSVSIRTDWTNWLFDVRGVNSHEMTYTDGKKTEWICFAPNVTNSHIATEIRLFPAFRPLDSRIEEHVWFALFSRKLFVNRSSPFKDVGLCMDEPCIFTKWELGKDATSPRIAQWHNEWADQRPKATMLKGEFRWLEWTNLGFSLTLPIKSSLTIYAKPPDGDSVPISESELDISNLATGSIEGITPPKVLGSCVVYDSRTIRGDVRREVAYQTQAGKILPVDSPAIANRFKRLEQKHPVKIGDKLPTDVRPLILIAFIASSASLLFFLIWNLRTKKTNKA